MIIVAIENAIKLGLVIVMGYHIRTIKVQMFGVYTTLLVRLMKAIGIVMLNKRSKKVSMENINPELLTKLIQLKVKTNLNSSVYEILNGPIKIFLHRGKKIQAKKVNSAFAEDLHKLHRIKLEQEIRDRFKPNEYEPKGGGNGR